MVRIGTDGSLSSLSPSLPSRRSLPPTILLRQLPSPSLSLSLALAVSRSRSPALALPLSSPAVSPSPSASLITGGATPSPAASLIAGGVSHHRQQRQASSKLLVKADEGVLSIILNKEFSGKLGLVLQNWVFFWKAVEMGEMKDGFVFGLSIYCLLKNMGGNEKYGCK